jgi:hypothetical protein
VRLDKLWDTTTPDLAGRITLSPIDDFSPTVNRELPWLTAISGWNSTSVDDVLTRTVIA